MERMRDFAPCSLREAETMAHEGGATGFEQALTTLLLATGLGQIAPLPDSPEETATRRRFTAALNTHLTAKDDAHWLASPLTGAGVKASVSDRALLKALGIA